MTARTLVPIGVDLSTTSTGWAVWGGTQGRIRPKGLVGIERRHWIAREVVGRVDEESFPVRPLVVLEAVPTHGAFAIAPLAMLHGVVLEALVYGSGDATACIAYVPGTVLKKYLTGSGTAKKEQVVAAAQALGYAGKSHDEADAYGLALIGHHLLGGSDHLTPQRSSLLAAVAWEVPLPEVVPTAEEAEL